MCKEINCKKSPIYNFEGEKKRLYCSLHKLEGMINVKNKTFFEKLNMIFPPCYKNKLSQR